MNFPAAVEPLESRIAPAVFFVNGTNLVITDDAGNEAHGGDVTIDGHEVAAATMAGATKAVLLAAGDSLVYDANGNHKADKGEAVLVKMTAGSAMAFFTDLNTNAAIGQTPHFDLNEFTGLALGPDVKATINATIRGSVDTLLDASNALTTVRQPWNIAGLTITGTVIDRIQAGGNITGIKFIAPKTGALNYDVGGIVTGNAGSPISLNGGTTLSVTFTQAAGTDAGDITNITLPRGLDGITTGSGGDATTGVAGAGGDISKIKLTGQIDEGFTAGNGGNNTGGAGGVGGSISKLTLKVTSKNSDNCYIQGGSGGNGSVADGGAGGSVSDVSLLFTTDFEDQILITGGSGGNGGSSTGNGGAGGNVIRLALTAMGYLEDNITIAGGFGGGAGATSGAGGKGGNVEAATIQALGVLQALSLTGGDGGSGTGVGKASGEGGSVISPTVKILGHVDGTPLFAGGNGGTANGVTTGAAGGKGGSVIGAKLTAAFIDGGVNVNGGAGGKGTGTGVGGVGGSVSKTTLSVAASNQDISLLGGSGGQGQIGGDGGAVTDSKLTLTSSESGLGIYGGTGGAGLGASAGGKGGAVTKATLKAGDLEDGILVISGQGGDGGPTGGDGGASGVVNAINVTVANYARGRVSIGSRDGGSASGITGNGGASGDVSVITVTTPHGADSFDISAGAAGSTTATTGNGGVGGSVSKVTIKNAVALVSQSVVSGGRGGNSDHGSGGAGGAVFDIKLTDTGTSDPSWELFAGTGGLANGAGGIGGDGGDLLRVNVMAPAASVIFGSPSNGQGHGGTGANSKGGAGGNVDSIKGAVRYAAVAAQFGGDAEGQGGDGGSISNVSLKVGAFVKLITAGNGGSVAAGGTAGLGGSVSKTTITGSGDVGDFANFFGTGIGGLGVGAGGAVGGVYDSLRNGSIDKVTANRIAAILAVTLTSGLGERNAVKSITGLKVGIIGADIDVDGQFDYAEGNSVTAGFQLGALTGATDTDDLALDGLVIVRTGGYTPDAKTKFLTVLGYKPDGAFFV